MALERIENMATLRGIALDGGGGAAIAPEPLLQLLDTAEQRLAAGVRLDVVIAGFNTFAKTAFHNLRAGTQAAIRADGRAFATMETVQ